MVVLVRPEKLDATAVVMILDSICLHLPEAKLLHDVVQDVLVMHKLLDFIGVHGTALAFIC